MATNKPGGLKNGAPRAKARDSRGRNTLAAIAWPLKYRRILITAGPTWVALDKVRVISNIATGESGFILAQVFRKLGAKVTLVLGPGIFFNAEKGVKVLRFKYFNELEIILKKELRRNKYSAVIHTAAVADYQPDKIIMDKVSSGLANWKITLVPTKKLINSLKKHRQDIFAVGFKFEPEATKDKLIKRAKMLLKQANLDLVVANTDKQRGYQAYIINRSKEYGPFLNKLHMAAYLAKLLSEGL